MNTIFVYGTLRGGGHWNGVYLEGKTGKPAVIEGLELFDIGSIPAAVKSDLHGERLVGEVFEVSDDTLTDIDHLECHPTWYKREQLTTTDGDLVWVYLQKKERLRSTSRKVLSGDWMQHTAGTGWSASRGA